VGFAVGEDSCEGCEIDAEGLEVEGLDAGDWFPEIGVDAAGINPGIDGSYSGRDAVDADFGFSVAGAAAAL
jgi:hypothetical protein